MRLNPLRACLLMLLALGGCDNQQPEEIHWQMPLETEADPHGVQVGAAVPDWAASRQGEAELVWLEKSTTRVQHVSLRTGETASVQGFEVHLLGLAQGLRNTSSGAFLDDQNVDNPAAFVEISRHGKGVYRGWLYAKFPEMFGMDNPQWKVWLKGINLRPAS